MLLCAAQLTVPDRDAPVCRSWSAEALAQHFGVRVQRALAILALKEKEHAARAAGLPLHTELAGGFA